jgi:hypothetical protein
LQRSCAVAALHLQLRCCPSLKETDRFISLGGGNAAGEFTAEALQTISRKASLDAIVGANYTGVVFDVEEVVGPSSVMVGAFAAAFAACKQSGLKVAVTTSHSAPYQVDSPSVAVDLVKAWAGDTNIVRQGPSEARLRRLHFFSGWR